jgi:hypothetical protein
MNLDKALIDALLAACDIRSRLSARGSAPAAGQIGESNAACDDDDGGNNEGYENQIGAEENEVVVGHPLPFVASVLTDDDGLCDADDDDCGSLNSEPFDGIDEDHNTEFDTQNINGDNNYDQDDESMFFDVHDEPGGDDDKEGEEEEEQEQEGVIVVTGAVQVKV